MLLHPTVESTQLRRWGFRAAPPHLLHWAIAVNFFAPVLLVSHFIRNPIMMKFVVIAVILVAGIAFLSLRSNRQSVTAQLVRVTPTNFFELKYTDIHGHEVSMAEYRGKYVLCVNVASKCGNTPQYEKLQQLYEKHKDQLVIIGFPCNQFLGQEPGSEKDIESFCQKNYGVTFPLASKLEVKGKNQHPVYTWLTNKELNGVEDASVEWNFHKFLVSPEGKWLQSFSAKSDPMNGEIEALLR